MATYLVQVETKHMEHYYVEADSEEQARKNWMEAPMDISECTEVLGVDNVEKVED